MAASNSTGCVRVWTEELSIPTYLPAAPDKNPMFLEKRVYQGSSGKVYPLPFTDRIAEKPVERKWKAVWIENEYLRALVLPEIGGRIHILQDKTNGYDLVYNQSVIKPALVGLAGPWISGGIEFNWPQHHRPATFLPVETEIEEHQDGAKTIWCGDHDPITRMKGMHGVCLHPGKAYLELKVRAYNRTPFVQTFLWWANAAIRVHEAYQSFFPPDVCYVADHARRSMSEYPLAKGYYYGVNYGRRGREGVPPEEVPVQYVPPRCLPAKERRSTSLQYAPNDLSLYANIPTPCSYMCMGSKEDFFGGYDHEVQAGIIHYADHHIAPGKKQWTWGNHEFGYAWDRNLTDRDEHGEYRPYIELMAGVYADNQPDFSFLQPGETKTWSQYWYPIQQIGPAQHANLDAAVSLRFTSDKAVIGVAVTRALGRTRIRLERADGSTFAQWKGELAPGKPIVLQRRRLVNHSEVQNMILRVLDQQGREVISYRPTRRIQDQVPPPATEPPAPRDIASADELYLTGLHLEQYRHATRCPTLYWSEALRRDPGDARCNEALGIWHLRRGEFEAAERHLRRAIERLTLRNANPEDGKAHYHLGLCLRYMGREKEAYGAFYKATWNQGWAPAAYHALAEIDCTARRWATALDHLDRALRLDNDNLRARNLKVLVLRQLGQRRQAEQLLAETRQLDRLDAWARRLSGEMLDCDLQARLDIAHDYARAGFLEEAIWLLEQAQPAESRRVRSGGRGAWATHELPDQSWGAAPLVSYTLGWLEQRRGNDKLALKYFTQATRLPPDYCFPARLEEIAVLESALGANPRDARAAYYLGCLLYDRRRHREAIRWWKHSARLDPGFSVVWRNLGIGYYNILHKPKLARGAYDKAFRANAADARLLYERDQLWKRLAEKPATRLRELEQHASLVRQRDDLSVELCALYNQTGQPEEALALLSSRKFQPWEGGEGAPLAQWERSHLALGRRALENGDAHTAKRHFAAALTAPHNLGEAKHLLANRSAIHYWLGRALSDLGQVKAARKHWLAAAAFKGDFQEMSVRPFSELSYYSARAWECLGQKRKARKMFVEILVYARRLRKAPAKIDYFATSLPSLLLFEDDLSFRQETHALLLESQAFLGLGHRAQAKERLRQVLARDPNHAAASDLIAEMAASSGRARSPTA